MDHARYDKRRYPVVGLRDGYRDWAPTYDRTVLDEMDLRLLERLRTVEWAACRSALDLACGTGRVGAWLRRRTSGRLDGVDLTPEMIEQARDKGVYDSLRVVDATATACDAGSYEFCTMSLADEHFPELGPVYREAARVVASRGCFVLVGYHPHFLMSVGMPTHFDRAPGEPVTIRTYVHLFSDHVKAARAAGWSLMEMDERLIDDAWLKEKPKWEVHRDLPISFAIVWRRA